MGLSKTIERQLARIEATIAQREQPEETPQEQYARRQQEGWQRYWNRYYECINQVLFVMEEEFYALALSQLEATPSETIMDVRGRYEYGFNGILPPLASGVCRLASRLMHQEGLTFPIPCAFPASVCRFVQEHGEEIYRHNQWVPVGSSGRTVMAPQYAWLDGGLICGTCYFPTPHKRGAVYKLNLDQYLEKPDCPELPFKVCPACDGSSFEWIG